MSIVGSSLRARLGAAAVVVGGAGATYFFDDVYLRLNATRRAVRTFTAVGMIALDYKYSLRGMERGEPEFAEAIKGCNQRAADRLLWLCRKNGGVFVKAGQHVASMRPAMPPEFTDTLSQLMDAAPESTPWEVERIVKMETGKSINEIFSKFDPKPVGCASLAQVHKAVLASSGETVAVKVQHARLLQDLPSDTLVLQWSVTLVEALFKDLHLKWVLDLFTENMAMELDFRHEAANALRSAENFRDSPHVYVPKVVREHTSRRLLLMEFVEGCKINDLAALKRMGVDAEEVAQEVTRMFGEMIFVHGFVHCDPHPGNLMVRTVQPEPGVLSQIWAGGKPKPMMQVVLLDHGMYRVLSDEFRLSYCALWRAMVLQDRAGLDAASAGLGVGAYAELFPLMFTNRAIDSKTRLGHKMSKEERKKALQQLRQLGDHRTTTAKDVNDFLRTLPQDLLFVLRTHNLVRALNSDLGRPATLRFNIYANLAMIGLARGPQDQFREQGWTPRTDGEKGGILAVRGFLGACLGGLWGFLKERYILVVFRLRLSLLDLVLWWQTRSLEQSESGNGA